MDIFIVEKNIVKPTTHALMIPEFLKIWERDKSERKSRATLELSYIEFCLSGRKSNPFSGYTDEERPIKIQKVLNLGADWTPDRYVLLAMDRYEELQYEGSLSYRYFESVKAALSKLIVFYNTTLDFTKENNSGTPIYKPKDITDAISKASVNMKQLQEIQAQVEKELFQTNKTIRNRKVNHYEKISSVAGVTRKGKYE